MKPSPKPRKPLAIPKASGPDPAALTAEVTASKTEETSRTSSTSRTSRTSRVSGRPGKEQLAIWMDADVLGRARSAWRAESVADVNNPYMPFSQWIANLIETAVIDSEQRLNHGLPYRSTPKGQIGRSTRQ